jgi:hypothetical protein
MFSEEMFTVIKADREREIKAAQRAHLADRSEVDEGPAEAIRTELHESIRKIVGPAAQPGRATTDPSL